MVPVGAGTPQGAFAQEPRARIEPDPWTRRTAKDVAKNTTAKNLFEKDRALSRRFQKIDVMEPSIEETVQILDGLKTYYEEHHGVKYTPAALEAAASLSARHVNFRRLPDKAIDVIDEAGSRAKLQKYIIPDSLKEKES